MKKIKKIDNWLNLPEKTSKKFPRNPFPDVKPQEFNKLNKKRVTEDFVSENFKLYGWEVFEPFTDTGIDRIMVKKVCPQGHTSLEKGEEEKCDQCGKESIDIIRFVQVKTRALKNSIFGFTLKSKDFRIDPRHIFLFYCDTTVDFLILSVYDYLKFFNDIGSNPFASTSFRKGNNKLNTLKYNNETDLWSWGSYSWEQYRNLDGLKNMQNPIIELNLNEWIEKTRTLNNKMLIKFSSGGSYPKKYEDIINNELDKKLNKYSNKEEISQVRERILKDLQDNIKDPEIFDSVMKYWETIKNLEIIQSDGED